MEVSKGEQERLERASSAKRRKFKQAVVWIIVLAVIAAAVYGLVAWSRQLASQKPGEAIVELGRDHIEATAPSPEYNSNPPTSGPHYAAPANWGIYDEPLPDEQLLHNLEHGGVWISYRDSDNQELITQLKDIAGDYKLKVILTPRPENDAAIALAAWGRLLKLETFDKGQIKDFIKAFINKGPEQVPF